MRTSLSPTEPTAHKAQCDACHGGTLYSLLSHFALHTTSLRLRFLACSRLPRQPYQQHSPNSTHSYRTWTSLLRLASRCSQSLVSQHPSMATRSTRLVQLTAGYATRSDNRRIDTSLLGPCWGVVGRLAICGCCGRCWALTTNLSEIGAYACFYSEISVLIRFDLLLALDFASGDA